MFELLALTALIYLFLARRKKPRTPRTLDAELKQLIQESTDATAIGAEIKRFLLDVISSRILGPLIKVTIPATIKFIDNVA